MDLLPHSHTKIPNGFPWAWPMKEVGLDEFQHFRGPRKLQTVHGNHPLPAGIGGMHKLASVAIAIPKLRIVYSGSSSTASKSISHPLHGPVRFAEKTSRNNISADLLKEKNSISTEKIN